VVGGNGQGDSDSGLGPEPERWLPAGTAAGRRPRVGPAAGRVGDLGRELDDAVRSRAVIEQAKGLLAERYGLSIDLAFDLLDDSARSSGTHLQDLAEAVVSSRRTPSEILAALPQLEPRIRFADRRG